MDVHIKPYEIDGVDVDKASSSWSGFVYQGKVAIYTVLKYLNHYYPRLGEIEKYELEIEYLEDFSIIKEGKHVSLHQVKAKPETNTIGSYNEANLNLLGKLAKYPTVEEVNLHTAVEIKSFGKDDIYKGLKGYDVSKKKKELTNYKQLIFEKDQFESFYSKLKISCNTGEIPLERVIGIDNIKEMILTEIELFYSKYENSFLRDQGITDENKYFIYSNFINLIEENVHKDHLKSLDSQKILIRFKTFLDILMDENVFSFDKKTFSSLLIHMIVDDFNDYCTDFGIEDDDITLHETWRDHLRCLNKFNPEDFYLLCRKLTPHLIPESSDKLSIGDFRNLMQSDGVRDSFIHALISFATKVDMPTNVESAYIIQDGKEFYTLSTINRRGPNAHNTIGELIYKNLNTNDEMLKMLFEMDGYINSCINNVFTGSITRIQSDDSSDVITEKDRKSTITSLKTIRFLEIDKLKEEILNDSNH